MKEERIGENEARQNINRLLSAELHLPNVHRGTSSYVFNELYKEQGIDLSAEFAKRATTAHQEEITENFVHNKTKGPVAQLAEALPLLANVEGRVGDYIQATITKTAKPDDEGNSFVDLIIEMKNDWLASPDAPKEAKDLPARMKFLVDVTAGWGEALEKKSNSLKDNYLVRGKEANVLCYKDPTAVGALSLGLTRPKIIVAQTPHFIENVGAKLGGLISQNASDSFSIINPAKFNAMYQEYFLEFMQAIKKNAQDNIDYMEQLVPDKERKVLIDKYKKIVAYITMYEKTPVTKTV